MASPPDVPQYAVEPGASTRELEPLVLPAQRPASPEIAESPSAAIDGVPTPGPSALAVPVPPRSAIAHASIATRRATAPTSCSREPERILSRGDELGYVRADAPELRAGEVETLAAADREVHQARELALALDALRDDDRADVAGERDDRGGQRLAHRVLVDPAHERAVELEDLRVHARHVAEGGEAGADVVDRDAHAMPTQAPERLVELGVVLHRLMLGELDDDRALLTLARDQRFQLVPAEQRWGDVE